MSVCLETSTVLAASQVSTSTTQTQLSDDAQVSTTVASTAPVSAVEKESDNQAIAPFRATTIQKLSTNLPKASLITVLNAPLGNVTKLCVTPAVSSNATGQFTVLNSTNSLNIAKPQTITLINTPVTVVKTISPSSVDKSGVNNNSASNNNANIGTSMFSGEIIAPVSNTGAIPTTNSLQVSASGVNLAESRGHNVFVKNTSSSAAGNDAQDGLVPQSHKLLTANNFPTNNILTTAINVAEAQQKAATNGQRSKVKILSNILMPGTSSQTASPNPGNVLLNKTNNPQGGPTSRYVPRHKMSGPPTNNNGVKYLNKPGTNLVKNQSNLIAKPNQNQLGASSSSQRVFYPTHKSQIKTLSPMNNYLGGNKMATGGIKTLPPSLGMHKGIPGGGGGVQRSGCGLRTLPPQRAPKMAANKPNYIGKHAVQAQKMKTHKMKNLKPNQQLYNSYHHSLQQQQQHYQQGGQQVHANQKLMSFNQALTAEILETLGNSKSGDSYSNKSYDTLPPRYDSSFYTQEKANYNDQNKMDERNPIGTNSGLDTLSLICQAVLLDHNYNATLPPDSPTRSLPIPNTLQSQINGITSSSASSMYSPPGPKRRTISGGASQLPSASSATASLAVLTAAAASQAIDDDDAASDISDASDRKQDTEGEETDTAPEAEAVNNDDPFGDYVTRCICGFIHDDGYMIECDRCKVWQHVQCVVKNRQVPEEYLCEICDPRKQIDRSKARLAQQQWLRDRQFINEAKLKKDLKIKESVKQISSGGGNNKESDTDSSDGEQINNNVGGGASVAKGRPTLMNRRKSDNQRGGRQRRDSGVQKRQIKKRERKINKRKTKAQLKGNHSDDENHENLTLQNPSNNSNHLPQLRQWIDKYEEAVTNHYSPELRARISNIRVNGIHTDSTLTDFDPSVHKCRVHTQPLTELKYIVSTVQLTPNSAVIELRGKYMLSAQHRNTNSSSGGGTFNTRQHAQRPGPFLFFYRLHKDNTEVCVDTRTYGNSARFVRRSCKPNAEIRHSIIKGVLHLYIVAIANIEKNSELTIKHESHDLAAIGTTRIACACGGGDECTVNRTSVKKNGNSVAETQHKKRRGRRTNNVIEAESYITNKAAKKELPSTQPAPATLEHPIKDEIEESKPETEQLLDLKPEPKTELKTEPNETLESPLELKSELITDEIKEEHDEPVTSSPPPPPPLTPPIQTRRSSHRTASDREDGQSGKDILLSPTTLASNKKKMNREERKLQAILRAIDQMEKSEHRKQEHKAKQQHRRESEPGLSKEEDCPIGGSKSGGVEPKTRRKRRKGRARTSSTHTPGYTRNRLNSTDSYLTSGDETMLSPNDNAGSSRNDFREAQGNLGSPDKDVGLLLALSNGSSSEKMSNKSPARECGDSNSNSAQSSPETQLSSACLLVQAAVEPLEQGFKFPKTKKGLMNEWLNKAPEPVVHSASAISPSSLQAHINNTTSVDDYIDSGCSSSGGSFYNNNSSSSGKSLVALAQVASFCTAGNDPNCNVQVQQAGGSAKKRWLRQAISEDQCDSPSSRPESPPISETIAPPKKRRLPRESLSNDITPPTTPTSLVPPTIIERAPIAPEDSRVEIVYNSGCTNDDDSPSATIESDAILEERVAEMKEEFAAKPPVADPPAGCPLDPRLTRPLFLNSDHLVGTVEKTLSIFGFEDHHRAAAKPEAITPAKRKLSITEYRQRKKLNNNDKMEEQEGDMCGLDENQTSSESFTLNKPMRERSNSSSSGTSMTSSSDEEPPPALELQGAKALSAFNSEPTELERQREITSLRLKKAFGIGTNQAGEDGVAKPKLDVEAILNCEIPDGKVVMPPSPTFPIPGVVADLSKKCDSPRPLCDGNQKEETFEDSEQKVPECEVVEVEMVKDESFDGKMNLFYTPDEDLNEGGKVVEKQVEQVDDVVVESKEVQGNVEDEFVEMETMDYVPPFNNPIYPNDSTFATYASLIDEEGRYEGRNPSPPPDMSQT